MIEIDGVKGHLIPGDVQVLQRLASLATNILEVGSYLGLSARIMAKSNPLATVWCIDTWDSDTAGEQVGDSHYQQFLRNTTGLYIVPIRGDSAEMIARFQDRFFDLAWIDGDHTDAGCYRDIKAALPKMRRGSVLAGHDAAPSCGVPESLERFRRAYGYDVKITQPPGAHYAWEVQL